MSYSRRDSLRESDPHIAGFSEFFSVQSRAGEQMMAVVSSSQALLGPNALALVQEILAGGFASVARIRTHGWRATQFGEEQARVLAADHETLLQLLPRFPPLIEAMEAVRAAQDRLARGSPCGRTLLDIVESVIKTQGSAALAKPRDLLTLAPHKQIDAGATLLANTAPDDWAAQAEGIAKQTAVFAETEYKATLRACLSLTRIERRGLGHSETPHQLGQVVSECASAWAKRAPNLLRLLNSDLVLCRNSEQHRSSEYDLEQRRVLFQNEMRATSPVAFSLEQVAWMMADALASSTLVRAVFATLDA